MRNVVSRHVVDPDRETGAQLVLDRTPVDARRDERARLPRRRTGNLAYARRERVLLGP